MDLLARARLAGKVVVLVLELAVVPLGPVRAGIDNNLYNYNNGIRIETSESSEVSVENEL